MKKENNKEYCVNSLMDVKCKGKNREFIFRADIVCENDGNNATELITGEEFLLYPELFGMPNSLPHQIVIRGFDKEYYSIIARITSDENEYKYAKTILRLLKKLEKKISNKKKVSKDLYQVLEGYSKYNERKEQAHSMCLY